MTLKNFPRPLREGVGGGVYEIRHAELGSASLKQKIKQIPKQVRNDFKEFPPPLEGGGRGWGL